MTSHGSPQADLGSLRIAHFADQNDIWILTQGGTQHAGKCQVNFFIHLHLIDAGQTILDWVFHGNDFLVGGVDFR